MKLVQMCTPSVWFFGKGILYSIFDNFRELMAGEIPHNGLKLPQITAVVGYDDDFKMPIPDCHPRIENIMELCLRKNPKERPTFETIFQLVEQAEKEISRKCKYLSTLLHFRAVFSNFIVFIGAFEALKN